MTFKEGNKVGTVFARAGFAGTDEAKSQKSEYPLVTRFETLFARACAVNDLDMLIHPCIASVRDYLQATVKAFATTSAQTIAALSQKRREVILNTESKSLWSLARAYSLLFSPDYGLLQDAPAAVQNLISYLGKFKMDSLDDETLLLVKDLLQHSAVYANFTTAVIKQHPRPESLAQEFVIGYCEETIATLTRLQSKKDYATLLSQINSTLESRHNSVNTIDEFYPDLPTAASQERAVTCQM